MIDFKPHSQGLSSSSGDGFTLKVLGVGGAGSNVLDRLVTGGGDPEKLVMLNSNARALSNSFAGTKIQLGKRRTMGLGCGGDPDLGRESAVEATQEIRDAIRGCGMIFLCVGLGGGTGSGAAPVVARIAREEDAFVVVFVTMPFNFEGRRRVQQANLALEELKESANALLVFENDRMSELIGPEEDAQQAFVEADKMVCLSIRSIMALVERPGMIRIGMDELMAVLQGKDSRCLFGFGRATGRDRGRRAVELALANPMLKGAEMLGKDSKLLVHVSGDESVKLSEVEEVMETLRDHVDASADVLFGVSTTEELGEGLCVAIISSAAKEVGGSDGLTPKRATIGFNSSLLDSAPSYSEPEPELDIPAPPPSVNLPEPKPKPSSAPVFPYAENKPDSTSPVPLDSAESSYSSLDDAPSSKSEPIFPPPAPPKNMFTFDSRVKDDEGAPEEPESGKLSFPPPSNLKSASGPSPVEDKGSSEQPITPLVPPSVKKDSPPAKAGASIFEVVDEDDDEVADDIPVPSGSKPFPGMSPQPGVKIDTAPGKNSAPTITLDQPKPSLASTSIDASATRPYGPSTGLPMPSSINKPASSVDASNDDMGTEDVPAPLMPPPTAAATSKSGLTPPKPPVIEDEVDPLPPPAAKPSTSLPPSSGEPDLGKKILEFDAASVSKKSGRFEKTEPTLIDGQDLDVPTYLRKKKRG